MNDVDMFDGLGDFEISKRMHDHWWAHRYNIYTFWMLWRSRKGLAF